MNIDFHIHSKLSKTIDFSSDYFIQMIKEGIKEGLTAFALTEHFNTLNFLNIYDVLDYKYQYIQDSYNIEGFHIFPGMEVDIKEGGHILIIGGRDSIRNIRMELADNDTRENFIPFYNLLKICRSYEVLKIGAHPLRDSYRLTGLPKNLLSELDCFDLNAKDLDESGAPMYDRIMELSHQIGIPFVGGSDAHCYPQVGSIINHFEENCYTISTIKSEIAANKYSISVSPRLHLKMEGARAYKEKNKVDAGTEIC